MESRRARAHTRMHTPTPLASSQTVPRSQLRFTDARARACTYTITPFPLQCKWHCIFEWVMPVCRECTRTMSACACRCAPACICAKSYACVCTFAMPYLLICSSISTMHLCFPSLPVHRAQLLLCSTHCTILARPTMHCIRLVVKCRRGVYGI